MAGPVYIDQAALEAQYQPIAVRRLFADDGSGTPGPRLAQACEIAARQADAILLKAWSAAQIPTLVTDDAAVKAAICKLAMAVGGDGKPEWTGEGAPFANAAKDALAMLELLAKAQLRSRAESTAGGNPNLAGSVASVEEPPFMFAPTIARPRPGGY